MTVPSFPNKISYRRGHLLDRDLKIKRAGRLTLFTPPSLVRGGSRNFLKGGLYTIVVTFNANGVEGELRPRPLTRALKSSGAMPLPPL